jgi:hypothetical protein
LVHTNRWKKDEQLFQREGWLKKKKILSIKNTNKR